MFVNNNVFEKKNSQVNYTCEFFLFGIVCTKIFVTLILLQAIEKEKVMENKKSISSDIITEKIYTLRGTKVMLDRDLALLFEVKNIRLREQVKRNLSKFPEHFMFRLTEEETEMMVSQNAIPSKKHLGGSLPYVFTEHGVLQLSNVINNKKATEISIRVIEVFVQMRAQLAELAQLKTDFETIKRKLTNNSKNIEVVFSYIDELLEKKEQPRKKIGFKN